MAEKIIALSQSNYLPWKGYFDMINSVDEFYLVDSFQFTTRDWRSRNKIKSLHGPMWLSVPISSKNHYNMTIDEALVVEDERIHWRKKHWRSIVYNYRKTRFFEEFKKGFEQFYLETDDVNLSNINEHLIRTTCRLLGIKTPVMRLSVPVFEEDKTGRIVRVVKELGATAHLFGPNVRNYLNLDMFRESGLKDLWMDYSNYPEYAQPYPPFTHQVSIINLIFSEGPDAPKFMKSFGSMPTYIDGDEKTILASLQMDKSKDRLGSKILPPQ